MKLIFHLVLIITLLPGLGNAQITGPVIRANFGVDADLRTNYFNGSVLSGNDDWFNNGTAGTGLFVIDTTGAAAVLSGYTSNPASKTWSIYRNMAYPKYSVINGRLLVDAVYMRDYHGNTDSTTFGSGSNKNGMSPFNWSCPVSQSVPTKNEILDMLVHIRREGPNTTDSLWLFGGVSLEGTTGNRYFDFELFQSDIYYDRPSRKFYNYGPDLGHTTWQFNGSGSVIAPGDIIFTAEYGSGGLVNIETRIWVHQSSLSLTPATFNWAGQFDGGTPGAQYGYASIQPKSAGVFYTGLQNTSNIWPGPFNIVLTDNNVYTNYTGLQFMEFSVNLTKIGLDPVDLLSSDVCNVPFKRIMVKSRASTSFTAALKDFIAPIDLFIAPRVDLEAEVPYFCGSAFTGSIDVANPHPTSNYTWSTLDGHIIGSPTGTQIFVDSPGTYIVSQALVNGCSAYATDTITLIRDVFCYVLSGRIKSFNALYDESKNKTHLIWTVQNNETINSFYIEKSYDGSKFIRLDQIASNKGSPGEYSYSYYDEGLEKDKWPVYYRIKMKGDNNLVRYSQISKISPSSVVKEVITVMPNPVKGAANIGLQAAVSEIAEFTVFNAAGKNILNRKEKLNEGFNIVSLTETNTWAEGVYYLMVRLNGKIFRNKIVILK